MHELEVCVFNTCQPITGSYYADELYYPTIRPAGFLSPPFPYAFPRFGPRLMAMGKTDEPKNVFLYISRYPGRERAVGNEVELVAAVTKWLLPELEFVHLVDPTVEKWRETAKLCYRAVVMMGPHGGALQNAIFMRNRSKVKSIQDAVEQEYGDGRVLGGVDFTPVTGTPVVVEFAMNMSRPEFRSCFVSLSTALGLRHYVVENEHFGYGGVSNVSVVDVMSVLARIGVLQEGAASALGLHVVPIGKPGELMKVF